MPIEFDTNLAIICLLSLLTICHGKTCYLGSIIHIKTEGEAYNSFTQIQCPTESFKCIRVEANYTVLGSKGSVVFGECSTSRGCAGNVCRETRSAMPDLSSIGITYAFTSCDEACCETDNCNAMKVADILKLNLKDTRSGKVGFQRYFWNSISLIILLLHASLAVIFQ